MITHLNVTTMHKCPLPDRGLVLAVFLSQNGRSWERSLDLKELDRTLAGRVDTFAVWFERLAAVPDRFAVEGSPTFLLLMDGREKARWFGKMDGASLKDFLAEALSGGPDAVPVMAQ